MHFSPLLGPVIALVAWSIVMLFWLAIKRAPFVRGHLPPGPHNWPAHNYEHLMEQPTLFYAIVLALVLMRFDHPINVWLAWGYVAFRIAHSIVQSTVNIVRIRFLLFFFATVCLVGLTVHAGIFFIRHG